MKKPFSSLKSITGIALFGVAASAFVAVQGNTVDWLPMGSSHAQDSTPKGSAGARGGAGAAGGGSKGAGTGGSTATPKGQGGPSSDSDAKGPKFGGDGSKPTPGTQGGKPAWAQEGLPADLELGRLNVARAPAQVIDRSLEEALSTLSPAFYNAVIAIADNTAMSAADKLAALKSLVVLSFTDTTMVRVDSPLQNLGLYKDILADSKIVAPTATFDASTSATRLLLLTAVFVGSASDKTVPVSTATVDALNKIMTLTLPAGVTSAEVAVWAEAVRQAIVVGHQ